MKKLKSLLLLTVLAVSANAASAQTMTVTGVITQSTQDGTGPAVNNPSLNNIADGDTYTVSLASGPITGPGTYDLTGSSLVFSDPTALASENSFGFISLTVTSDGSSDDLSLLGCLATGGCPSGDYLTLNFMIPSADLNSPSAPASMIPYLYPPLALQEDGGITDIYGSAANYSYIPTPEPPSFVLWGSGSIALILVRFNRQRKSPSL